MDLFLKTALAPLVLRLGLAAIFIFHGLGKINEKTGYGTKWFPPGLPGVPEGMQVPAQAATAWGELIGGIALAIGFLPRLAALGLIVIMAGAIYHVHWANGFPLMNPDNPGALGWEYNFAIIMICLAVICTGGGPIGVGRWLGYRRPTTP